MNKNNRSAESNRKKKNNSHSLHYCGVDNYSNESSIVSITTTVEVQKWYAIVIPSSFTSFLL